MILLFKCECELDYGTVSDTKIIIQNTVEDCIESFYDYCKHEHGADRCQVKIKEVFEF